MTDANLMLGRLIPDYFPKIFGKTADQPLDIEASKVGFEKVAKEINEAFKSNLSLDEIVYGYGRFLGSSEWPKLRIALLRFIKVANETMARPIRTLTEARGFETAKHMCVSVCLCGAEGADRELQFSLASFGGAGGQHACEIAKQLNIKKILIHRYSSILSAYGLALADRYAERILPTFLSTSEADLDPCRPFFSAIEQQEPSAEIFSESSFPRLLNRLNNLTNSVKAALEKQGFNGRRVMFERHLNMRWEGTDTAMMALGSTPRGDEDVPKEDFEDAFKKAYKHEFGFLLEGKRIIVDDIKVRNRRILTPTPSAVLTSDLFSNQVRGIGKTFDSLGPSVFQELAELKTNKIDHGTTKKKETTTSVYFESVGRVNDTPVYKLPDLEVGDVLRGPAMILDDTQTIVVVPDAEVTVTRNHLYIVLHD